MIAVIMQPTYLPWIGYFDLMDTADVFVFLDTVQFEKQSWQQRNRIKSGEKESKWLTVPVFQSLGQDIKSVRINDADPWRKKHWGTIEQFYRRALNWKPYCEGLEEIYSKRWESLLDLNITLIRYLKDQFEVKTKFVMASELPVSGNKVPLLVDICHHLKADTYLSPVGSATYIELDNIFEAEGISLLYHRFEHPVYSQQFSGFAPFMSSIDLLFNEGSKSIEVIRSGRLPYDV